MTTPPSLSSLFLLDRGAVAGAEAEAVLEGCALARADVAVVEVAGPGAIACLQGLLTNDVDRPGDGALVYGAVLTPKGMILSDLWCLRKGVNVLLAIPADGKPTVDDVLRKTLPPRLARAGDRPDVTVLRLVGPQALDVAARAGIALPEPGRSSATLFSGAAVVAARPHLSGPFALELHVEAKQLAALTDALVSAGAREAGLTALELARILAGWPRLGAEIDQKTLPQEVRFDEVDGVSYTKGCYTGQETVARVHFRGHVNRMLVGLSWTTAPDFSSTAVAQDDREIGLVTSAAWVAPIDRFIGLAKVRREADRTQPVVAGGVAAQIVELPFDVGR